MQPHKEVKLYIDEDVWGKLANTLRQRGYDAIDVHEANREGLSDEEQFVYAIHEGRAILSHNKRDFVFLAEKFFFADREHCGVIVSRRFPFGELLRRIDKLLQTFSAEELANTIQFLEDFD